MGQRLGQDWAFAVWAGLFGMGSEEVVQGTQIGRGTAWPAKESGIGSCGKPGEYRREKPAASRVIVRNLITYYMTRNVGLLLRP
jgi:hypothetical protein